MAQPHAPAPCPLGVGHCKVCRGGQEESWAHGSHSSHHSFLSHDTRMRINPSITRGQAQHCRTAFGTGPAMPKCSKRWFFHVCLLPRHSTFLIHVHSSLVIHKTTTKNHSTTNLCLLGLWFLIYTYFVLHGLLQSTELPFCAYFAVVLCIKWSWISIVLKTLKNMRALIVFSLNKVWSNVHTEPWQMLEPDLPQQERCDGLAGLVAPLAVCPCFCPHRSSLSSAVLRLPEQLKATIVVALVTFVPHVACCAPGFNCSHIFCSFGYREMREEVFGGICPF